MDFYFTGDTETLTKPVISGGLGLTQSDLNSVTRWQQDMSYSFNFHTGTHGDACVYVKVGTYNGYNLPCIWLEGTNLLKTRGGFPEDAKSVVSSNIELFKKMYRNFYGMTSTPTITITTTSSKNQYVCSNCGKNYGMYDDLIALGVAIGMYPPKCRCNGWITVK